MDDFDELTLSGSRGRHQSSRRHRTEPHRPTSIGWFLEPRLPRGAAHQERDRYIFREGRGDRTANEPPTDWICPASADPAWDACAPTANGTCTCSPWNSPTWNWKNPEVRADFMKTLALLAPTMAADGFRVDVAHGLAKDLERVPISKRWANAIGVARSHMRTTARNPLYGIRFEVHDIYREWREGVQRVRSAAHSPSAKPGCVPEHQHRYASPEELGQVFNFEFAEARLDSPPRCVPRHRGGHRRCGHTLRRLHLHVGHEQPRRPAPRQPLRAAAGAGPPSHHQVAKDWLLRDGTSYH